MNVLLSWNVSCGGDLDIVGLFSSMTALASCIQHNVEAIDSLDPDRACNTIADMSHIKLS